MLNTDELKQLKQIVEEANEPIIKRLDRLEEGQKDLRAGQTRLEQEQSTAFTAIKALGAGLQDVQEQVTTIRKDVKDLPTTEVVDTIVEAATKELKADIFELAAKVSRKQLSYEKRISNLEAATGTPNPDKH